MSLIGGALFVPVKFDEVLGDGGLCHKSSATHDTIAKIKDWAQPLNMRGQKPSVTSDILMNASNLPRT